MPFVSRRQKQWLKKHKPDIYELWDKETPKGVKLPYRVKKKKRKSAIEQIKLILAQQAPVAPAVPAAPAAQPVAQPAVAQPAAPAAQAPTAQPQYSNIDFNAAITMIPQVMQQLNSKNLGEVKNYMVTNLKADPKIVEQATTSFAVKIYKEEAAKRQQQVVQEVGKALGIDPSKIPNMNQQTALPPLPGMAASRRKRLEKIVHADMKRVADVSSAIDAVNSMSLGQKITNLYQFLSNFNSISDAVKQIFDFVSNFPPPGAAGAMATAQMSGKVAGVAAFLWVVSLFIVLGAAGTSDFNAKYWTKITDVDKLNEAKAMMMAVKAIGASSLATALAVFLKKREDKSKTEKPKGRALYEPFNK